MDIADLQTRLHTIDTYFRTKDPTMSERERIFSRTVKLNEEVGELCEAVLYEHDTNQRAKEKDIDLDSELADVLICTLLLAESRKQNVWDAVDIKLKKQFARFGLDT